MSAGPMPSIADQRVVATGIGTDGTNVGIADVVAFLTVFHLVFHLGDGLCEAFHILGILTQQMQRQAEGRLTSDARQSREFRDCLFEEL